MPCQYCGRTHATDDTEIWCGIAARRQSFIDQGIDPDSNIVHSTTYWVECGNIAECFQDDPQAALKFAKTVVRKDGGEIDIVRESKNEAGYIVEVMPEWMATVRCSRSTFTSTFRQMLKESQQ